MATLVCPGLGSFSAFSGNGIYRNRADKTDVKDNGALPEGKYYIVDKPVGGMANYLTFGAKEALTNFFGSHHLFTTDRSTWFALYRDDEKIDDQTYVHGVLREGIRLHPEGPRHVSEGCLTLHKQEEFDKLAKALREKGKMYYSDVGVFAYGTIQVEH